MIFKVYYFLFAMFLGTLLPPNTQQLFKNLTNFAKDSTIIITAVGDIMMGSPYPQGNPLPKADGAYLFNNVKNFLKGDIVMGNLEGCFLDTGISKKCKDTSKACYAFRMPVRYAKHLKNAGFNLMGIANNHINDFGAIGLQSTYEALKKEHIYFAGTYTQPHTSIILEKKKIKIAFCAFSPNSQTLNLNDSLLVKKILKKAKQNHDILIVAFHGGGEGANYQHVTREMEFFHHEKRGNVYHFAHLAIDNGADVVIGSGPHVPRALEVYKKRLIAYSLGNFLTYGQFNLQNENGLAPIIQIETTSKGLFLKANLISAKQNYVNLRLDHNEAALSKIKTLTEQDFPEKSLRFAGSTIFAENHHF